MCDPLSIQDQSVRGSNYCKFLCVLSTERERGEEKREQWQQQQQQQQPSLPFTAAWIHRFTLNLWKHFYPQLPFGSAELILPLRPHRLIYHPALLLTAHPTFFQGNLTGSQEVAELSSSGGAVRGSQSHHGRVPGAECVSGALDAHFAWCRLGGSCGGMQLPPSTPTTALLQCWDW